MLAALTCLLVKEGQKVVYIPDCRGLLYDVFGYLQHSLRLAFHGDECSRKYLEQCTTVDQLSTFCGQAASEFCLLFIIDQANVLDPHDEARDRITLDAKREARVLLDKITAPHLKIASATANYQHAVFDSRRQTGEKKLQVYGGLSDVSPNVLVP